MDYFGEGGLCYTTMASDVCEGTSLLSPKANFADWSHHCPPFPVSIASVPSFPASWDDCCGEDPTPVSFCDGNECPTGFVPAMNPVAIRDFQLSMARESAEYFGYILNHKRNLEIEIVEARNLSSSNSQCFVSLDHQKFSTPIATKTSHPTWNTHVLMTIRDYNDECEVEINVKNRGAFKKGSMGKCYIRPCDMHEMEVYDQWIQLQKDDGSKCGGEIRIRTVLGNPSLDSVVFSINPKGSFSSNFTINDELGNSLFTIEGRDNFHYLVDRFGTRVFDIKRRDTSRKVFAAEPIFDVYQADTDNLLATVSRKITLLKVEFFLDIMGQRVVSQRDKWSNNITLSKEDGSFVSFMKKPTVSNKSISIEIGPRENVPLLLCVSAFLNLEDTQFSD